MPSYFSLSALACGLMRHSNLSGANGKRFSGWCSRAKSSFKESLVKKPQKALPSVEHPVSKLNTQL
jgi:hypothetical protein